MCKSRNFHAFTQAYLAHAQTNFPAAIVRYISSAILSITNPDQFGAIPKSSTTHALISMIHNWTKATDATGTAVRIKLLDYCVYIIRLRINNI